MTFISFVNDLHVIVGIVYMWFLHHLFNVSVAATTIISKILIACEVYKELEILPELQGSLETAENFIII